MKKCKILFLFGIVCIMLFAIFGVNKVYALGNTLYEDAEIDSINNLVGITFDDSLHELNELLLYYQNELLYATESEQTEINNKIQKLEELISLFSDNCTNESNAEYYELGYDTPPTYFGISPDCTCDVINYLMQVPCKWYYKSVVYWPSKM